MKASEANAIRQKLIAADIDANMIRMHAKNVREKGKLRVIYEEVSVEEHGLIHNERAAVIKAMFPECRVWSVKPFIHIEKI